MEKLKKLNLLRIEKARLNLYNDMEMGIINEEDLINIFRKDINYGFRINGHRLSYREAILKDIFNSPFILCDLNLSVYTRNIFIYFLNARYEFEKEQLEYSYNNAFMSKKEYLKELDLLHYNYYETSEEGKIFENKDCNDIEINKMIGIKTPQVQYLLKRKDYIK